MYTIKSPFLMLIVLFFTTKVCLSASISAEDDTKEDSDLKVYTWEEVREHNTEESLWIVLYGRVYDLTEFQIDHPGGPDVLERIAGQDATYEFECILHTKNARTMARKYLIGKVEGEELGNLFEEITSPPRDSLKMSKLSVVSGVCLFLGAIVVMLVGLGYYFLKGYKKKNDKQGIKER